MSKYKIIYQCANGFEGTEYVHAVNRLMAFAIFEDLGYEGVINADVFRVEEDE